MTTADAPPVEAPDRPGDRRSSVVVLGVSAVVLVALAAWLVPWHPVPGGTPGPAAPGSVFTPEEIQRAEEFARTTRTWIWSSLAVSLVVACLFGFTRLGRRLVGRLPGPWFLRVVLAVAVLELLGRMLTLPFAVLLRREVLAHGLSTQSWWGFAYDQAVGELVTILTTAVPLLLVIACARRWRRAWPAVAGPMLAGLVLTGSFFHPLVVEPLFNSFTPLPHGELRTQILQLAEHEHVPVDEVLVADASRRTTTLNAYVSGFGSTRRVVLFDNVVDSLPREQTLTIVAHELSHARHGDVVTGTLLGAAGAGLGIGLLGLLVGAIGGRRRLAMGDPAVVPLVLALIAVGALVASPVQGGMSRQIETRADVDALRATEDPDAFITMQRELALRSLADPTPPAWTQFWFGSHPTVLQRVALARDVQQRHTHR
ncbi:MAG TPA: M48 family metallopeptidase [Nocardioides sp.]|nr:M48 family metallopeptidase [Nocardioides sp.]